MSRMELRQACSFHSSFLLCQLLTDAPPLVVQSFFANRWQWTSCRGSSICTIWMWSTETSRYRKHLACMHPALILHVLGLTASVVHILQLSHSLKVLLCVPGGWTMAVCPTATATTCPRPCWSNLSFRLRLGGRLAGSRTLSGGPQGQHGELNWRTLQVQHIGYPTP